MNYDEKFQKMQDETAKYLFAHLVRTHQDQTNAINEVATAMTKKDSANEEYWSYAVRDADARIEELNDMIDFMAKQF